MIRLFIYFALLGLLWAFLLAQTGQTQYTPAARINPGLNPVFKRCASKNDIAEPQSYLVELKGLTEPQKKIILACVLAHVVDDFSAEVSMAQVRAIFQVMPSLKEPDAADLLVPALYRADNLEALTYLLENTAVLSVKNLRQMTHDDFYGLTITQYQALRGNLPLAEHLIAGKFAFSANDNAFLHTIYDVNKRWFMSDERQAWLLVHGVDINALDDKGNTVLDRALAEDARSLQFAFREMGGTTAQVIVTNSDPVIRFPESVASIASEFRMHLRAEPLPLEDDATLFVYERDREIYAQIRHWRTNTSNSLRLPLPNRNQDGKQVTYATTVNEHGLWILGPRSVLITPDYDIRPVNISLDTSRGRYIVVGLDDGSLLLLSPSYSGERYVRIERIHVTDPASFTLESRDAGVAEIPTGGPVARKLHDGRVLVAGGMHLRGTRTWLYDPDSNQWSEQGNISTHRAFPAFAVLPDGRAFIASNSSSSSPDRDGVPPSAYSAEIWDPETGQWTALPALPLSFRVEAYRARGPSAAVLPDGSLIVAGGMHRQLVQLRKEGDGFADYWTLAGSTEQQRVGASVQVLGNDEVAVLGGAGPTDTGGCCWSLAGAERVAIPAAGAHYDTSVGLARNDAAVAHRNEQTFIAGGWQRYSMSSPTVQASGIAGIIDHSTGLTRPLPPLPSPALVAQAQWLDDHRILVKAIAHGRELLGERKRWSRGSLEGDFEGYLALFDTRTSEWRTLDDPRVARSALAGTLDNEAILVGPGVDNWAVNLDDLSLRQLPSRIAARSGGVARVLPDRRIVVVGGMAQKNFFQAERSSCTSDDCPLEWFSYGQVRPSHRYETWDPATNAWQLSAIREGGGKSAIVLDDGRVFALGRARQRWRVEISDSSRSDDEWQVLPMPVEIGTESRRETPSCGDHDSHEPRCTLLRGVLGDTELVFLRSDYWGKRSDTLHALWLYNEAEQGWSLVAQGLTDQELDRPRLLPLERNGSPVAAAFFGTGVPRVWQTPASVPGREE